MASTSDVQAEHDSMPPVHVSAICGSLSEQNATKMALNVAPAWEIGRLGGFSRLSQILK